jgi:hypothetical protein
MVAATTAAATTAACDPIRGAFAGAAGVTSTDPGWAAEELSAWACVCGVRGSGSASDPARVRSRPRRLRWRCGRDQSRSGLGDTRLVGMGMRVWCAWVRLSV